MSASGGDAGGVLGGAGGGEETGLWRKGRVAKDDTH